MPQNCAVQGMRQKTLYVCYPASQSRWSYLAITEDLFIGCHVCLAVTKISSLAVLLVWLKLKISVYWLSCLTG